MKQVERISTGNVQPWVSIFQIKKLLIPTLRNSFQLAIQGLVKAAYTALENSNRNYTQAETILLSEIGMDGFTPSKEAVNIKSFSGSFGATGRLDAEYYQKKYEEIEKVIVRNGTYRIAEVFDMLSNPSPVSYTETGLKVIKTKNVRIPSIDHQNIADHTHESRTCVQKGDLLFAAMGVGSLGRMSFIDRDYSDFTTDGTLKIFRTKPQFQGQNLEVPALLYLTSRLGQEMIYKYVIGSTGIISISRENIENLQFPKVNETTAKQLTDLVLESVAQKAESERLLSLAKTAVEMAIEQDEAAAMDFIEANR